MGTTSNYSWPYPESTDPVADGATDIQALADAADTTGRAIQLATVQVFADSTARDTALSGIEIEGMFAFLQDTDVLTYWDGSAWQEFATGAGTANFTDTATGTYSSGGKNYKYITFTSSGTITFDTAGLADILIVGGGGGGGASSDFTTGQGGGGAGGMLTSSLAYFDATTYTVTVGAGGASYQYLTGGDRYGKGLNGTTSRLGDFYGIGGGGGNGVINAPANAGGSGGGTSYFATAAPGVPGQGNDGGTSTDEGAGGGGAGAVGANSTTNNGGNGAGASSSITGSATDYAGGGGGGVRSGGTAGSGGTGGGGAGGINTSGTAGTANTGGGGGGAGSAGVSGVLGGNGGSGIVVVRVEV